MSDTVSIIESAMAEATDSGAFDDSSIAETAPETTDTNIVVEPVTAAPAVPGEEAVPNATATAEEPVSPDTRSEIDKLLEAEGIKPTVDNQRENRIPYKRVAKIVENAQKKLVTTHATEVAEVRTKLTAAEEKNRQMDVVDNLIVTDPDRYMAMLVNMHPDKYKKFVGGGGGAAAPSATPAKPAAVESVIGPRPGPDTKYEDGSLGYSPQQHEKLLDWVAQKATNDAVTRTTAEFTQRFGPIEEKWKSDQVTAQMAPKVQAQLDRNTRIWGEDFTKEVALGDRSPMYQLMMANPTVPFDSIVAQYMAPRREAAAKERENTVRATVLKEMETRAAAAAKTAPSAVVASVDSGPSTTDDVIRASIRAAGL